MNKKSELMRSRDIDLYRHLSGFYTKFCALSGASLIGLSSAFNYFCDRSDERVEAANSIIRSPEYRDHAQELCEKRYPEDISMAKVCFNAQVEEFKSVDRSKQDLPFLALGLISIGSGLLALQSKRKLSQLNDLDNCDGPSNS